MQLNIKNLLINVSDMEILELIGGNLIGFGLALVGYVILQLYLNSKERKKEKNKQKNFLSLIKDENIFNKTVIGHLRNKDFKMGETVLRLKTENKNACWGKIIDFYYANRNLINDISTLYELYRAINHILEYEPFYVGNKEKDDNICFQRQVALSTVIDEYDKYIVTVEKLIEEELKE